MADEPAERGVHHVELWVQDGPAAWARWGWLLERLGWTLHQSWDAGRSWRCTDTPGSPYVVVEQSPAVSGGHDRLRAGLNHLALHAGSRPELDALVAEAPGRGWTLMYADRHPHAGGPDHYAAYLEDPDGFELELVAD